VKLTRLSNYLALGLKVVASLRLYAKESSIRLAWKCLIAKSEGETWRSAMSKMFVFDNAEKAILFSCHF
jgi:hypothetical protein